MADSFSANGLVPPQPAFGEEGSNLASQPAASRVRPQASGRSGSVAHPPPQHQAFGVGFGSVAPHPQHQAGSGGHHFVPTSVAIVPANKSCSALTAGKRCKYGAKGTCWDPACLSRYPSPASAAVVPSNPSSNPFAAMMQQLVMNSTTVANGLAGLGSAVKRIEVRQDELFDRQGELFDRQGELFDRQKALEQKVASMRSFEQQPPRSTGFVKPDRSAIEVFDHHLAVVPHNHSTARKDFGGSVGHSAPKAVSSASESRFVVPSGRRFQDLYAMCISICGKESPDLEIIFRFFSGWVYSGSGPHDVETMNHAISRQPQLFDMIKRIAELFEIKDHCVTPAGTSNPIRVSDLLGTSGLSHITTRLIQMFEKVDLRRVCNLHCNNPQMLGITVKFFTCFVYDSHCGAADRDYALSKEAALNVAIAKIAQQVARKDHCISAPNSPNPIKVSDLLGTSGSSHITTRWREMFAKV